MLLLAALTALAISMATTPLMMRLAPYIGMVDQPDPRKVHAVPVPRVGGIGIIAGSLVAALLWMPHQSWLPAYLCGSLVLLVFGAADDAMELGHYTKFIGQIAAVAMIVYWGDLWVAHLPFVRQEIDPSIGKPFTMFALVGVINAMNHSDGLDGLAGGESLLSLGCMTYLSYMAGGMEVAVLAAAVGGGVFGFLRFNTHPARVFMGDAGSQFLGFSVGVLAILLTQRADSGLSMALPALIIGLPVVDILAVLGQRAWQGMNWFRATRNHVHHRLLGLGFAHSQSVVVIYSVQFVLVASAVALRYESDTLVTSVYVGVCAALFLSIIIAEKSGWRLRLRSPVDSADDTVAARGGSIERLAARFVNVAVPVFMLGAVLMIDHVPVEFTMAVVAILALAAASLLLKSPVARRMLLRLALYSGMAYEVYLLDQSRRFAGPAFTVIEAAFFILLGLAVSIVLRKQQSLPGFRTTPLDFLLVAVVIASAVLAATHIAGGSAITSLVVRLAILFYACELALDSARLPKVQEWSLIGTTAVLLLKTTAIVSVAAAVIPG